MHTAECRCMFCNALLGYKEGFSEPGLVTSGIGDCCAEFARKFWGIYKMEKGIPKITREIARRLKNAGLLEARKLILSENAIRITDPDAASLASLLCWRDIGQHVVLSRAAHTLDNLGWQGGWRSIDNIQK